MSKRGWIIVSIAAGVVAVLAGLGAGLAAYVHRARNAAVVARESFDPYYAIVQYLLTPEDRETTQPEPEL
ncbi:MAG TPA: hypothetical protein VKZ96_01645 [Thermomicrobiales bacterium]|nr:hypothetical protein [Thermomicrobiales bacterium]